MKTYLYTFPSDMEVMLIASIVIVVLLIPFIFYLITLQNALKAIQPQNRRMAPGNVWLLFIPLFNFVWQFIVVQKVAESIQAEQQARGIAQPDQSVRSVGIAYCVLNCASIVPIVGVLARLAALVCWIIHWVKVNEHRKRFLTDPFLAQSDSEIFGYGKY